jgi:hypothetical protein
MDLVPSASDMVKRNLLKKDALGEQNTQLFNKIADDILKSTKNIWWIFVTIFFVGLMIWLTGRGKLLPVSDDLQKLIPEIGLSVIYFSLTYLFLAFRNRKTRGRVFASALYADAGEQEIQYRLQIDKVISGGKILEVLNQLSLARGDHVKIMWSFFYREEHTAGLIDRCLQDDLKVQLILVKPVGYGLELRMKDVKGPYVKDNESHLMVSYKEVSLDNLNFLKDVLNAAERKPKILDLIDVRFVDEYVGRPLVIVETEKTGKMKLINFFKSVFMIFGRNFVPYSEKMFRSAIGIYLAREASKYPFIVYYPETSYATSQMITGDLVDFFNVYWGAGVNPFLGPDSNSRQKLSGEISMADLRKYLSEWEMRIEKTIELKYEQ